MLMEVHSSINVPLYRARTSYTSFRLSGKRYCVPPSHAVQLNLIAALQGTYWYHSHFQAQYCDGLRGPLVIYDPDDPQANLYDVDDGEMDTRS